MANNDVQHLIDMLFDMIDNAKNAPLSGEKCMINRDEALDLIDEIRAQLPAELKRAQELTRAQEEYVESAKREEARTKAEDRARERYRVANEYTEDALRRTEEAIQMALDEVKQSRANFRATSAEQMRKKRAELAQTEEN